MHKSSPFTTLCPSLRASPGIAVVSATRLWHSLRKWIVWMKSVSGFLTMKIYQFIDSPTVHSQRGQHISTTSKKPVLLDELATLVTDTVRELNSDLKLCKIHFIWNATRFRTASKFPSFWIFCFLLKLNTDIFK